MMYTTDKAMVFDSACEIMQVGVLMENKNSDVNKVSVIASV